MVLTMKMRIPSLSGKCDQNNKLQRRASNAFEQEIEFDTEANKMQVFKTHAMHVSESSNYVVFALQIREMKQKKSHAL